MRTFHGTLVAIASLAMALVLVGSTGVPAAAQAPRPILVVTVSDSPDPAPSGGAVIYTILIKNDGTTKARNVVVTIQIPSGTAVSKCTVLVDAEGAVTTPCAPPASNIVTVTFFNIKAHKQPRINLTLTMPSASTKVTVQAKANGDDVTDSGWVAAETTVLPPNAVPVTFLPSGRPGLIACGLTLSPDFFLTDTTVKLGGGLGCGPEPYGLKITASGKTLDLNKFKILGATRLGNVGILVSNAADVGIIGGNTGNTSGIESFDWCVKDEGPSPRLIITSLRCFRARTAAIDIISRKASITGVLIDKTVPTATTTQELPGGVGIRTRGDNARIKDSIVRRTGTLTAKGIGIWVAGTDDNGDGLVAQIDGNTTTMRIENNTGIGLRLDGGPHSVKDVWVDGVYNEREDDPVEGLNGVVVGLTGVNNLLDGVVVKQHGGHGFVVAGTGTKIKNSNVDLVGLDGFVVTGAGSTVSGNGVQNARHGFIVTADALDTDLETNETQGLDGDGFVVDGDTAILTGNSAQANGGRGFVIAGASGLLDTNTAENNVLDGFIVTGSGHTIKINNSKKNGGTGYTVSGSGNQLNSNAAELNTSSEWVIGAGNFDGGGNRRGSSFPAISFPDGAAYTSPN